MRSPPWGTITSDFFHYERDRLRLGRRRRRRGLRPRFSVGCTRDSLRARMSSTDIFSIRRSSSSASGSIASSSSCRVDERERDRDRRRRLPSSSSSSSDGANRICNTSSTEITGGEGADSLERRRRVPVSTKVRLAADISDVLDTKCSRNPGTRM